MSYNEIEINWYVLGPYGHTDFFDRAMGLLTPWSFVPHHILSYDDEMTYTQRIYNVILSLYDWWFHSWVVAPKQNDIARKYFSHLVGKCCKKIGINIKFRACLLVVMHSPHIIPRDLAVCSKNFRK